MKDHIIPYELNKPYREYQRAQGQARAARRPKRDYKTPSRQPNVAAYSSLQVHVAAYKISWALGSQGLNKAIVRS